MYIGYFNRFKDHEEYEAIFPFLDEDDEERRLMYITVVTRADGWVHTEYFWSNEDRMAYKIALVLDDYHTLGWKF